MDNRSVKVVCEYWGCVVDVYGDLESCGSVIVVCENNGSVVDVYGDKLKEDEGGCGDEWEELRNVSRREESIKVEWYVYV